VNRTWNDTNGNYVPDCDLSLRTSNGECGAVANLNFGGLTRNTTYADDAIHGYGRRGYNWDLITEVQRELRPGWSITGGYYRNWFGNFLVTDNTLVTPADYDPYCVTAPTDSRLPNGGGYQICGLYDIKPAKFGQVNSVVTQSDNFGRQRLVPAVRRRSGHRAHGQRPLLQRRLSRGRGPQRPRHLLCLRSCRPAAGSRHYY